jgi:hypothetical protein
MSFILEQTSTKQSNRLLSVVVDIGLLRGICRSCTPASVGELTPVSE